MILLKSGTLSLNTYLLLITYLLLLQKKHVYTGIYIRIYICTHLCHMFCMARYLRTVLVCGTLFVYAMAVNNEWQAQNLLMSSFSAVTSSSTRLKPSHHPCSIETCGSSCLLAGLYELSGTS